MVVKRLVVALVAAAALVLASATAGWAAPSPTGSANAMGYYLALGDSLAAGYQPTTGVDRDGGYTGDVLAGIQATRPKTRLVNLACPGERSTTMVSGGVCAYDEGNQLDQALEFLHAHGRNTRVVTVQVGANDVQRCVDRSTLAIDPVCIQAGMADVATYLPMILGKVHAEAPHAQVVVLNYYNPFLAAWAIGNAQLALQSAVLQGTLNTIIGVAAASSGSTVADVATAFQSTNWTVPPGGALPTNVSVICALTWMCSLFDIHANDAGYALIGRTVVARLG
ncbi:MAG: SGNH/GDSL hydrolase family protein [Actinomycetales bacterium]